MHSFLVNHSLTLGELRLVFYLPDDVSYLKLSKCAELDYFSYSSMEILFQNKVVFNLIFHMYSRSGLNQTLKS